MRIVAERQLAIVLGALAGTPRVVVGGNFATPWRALAVLDGRRGLTGPGPAGHRVVRIRQHGPLCMDGP
jgi:hypothetical protein